MKSLRQRAVAKYAATLITALVLYAAALVVSLRWLQSEPSEQWKYSIAVLPVLPALGILLAVIRFCQAMDERELRMQLEGLAFGFAATAIATFTYGFLQNAGLPDVSWVWVVPVMCVCWILGQVAARWRHA